MIRHVMMWRIKDAAGRSKQENIALCVAALAEMRAAIPDVLSLEVGHNFAQVDNAYDLLVAVEFADRAAFDHFLEHPAHHRVGEVVAPLRDAVGVVDYEHKSVSERRARHDHRVPG